MTAPETRGERPPRGEGRRERGDGRRERSERRGEGGREEAPPASESAQAMAPNGLATEPVASPEADSAQAREPRPQGEAGDGRRRSRDRYGRDRRERGERADREDAAVEGQAQAPEAAAASAPTQATDSADEPPRRPRYPTGFVSDEDAAAPTASPAAAPAAARTSIPRVQGYALPLEQLQQVAQDSGLMWVNSDAGKVAAVQAAIAAEPKPVHIPRERPAPVVIDEGPLVLVETRKDLSQVKLPFETSSAG